MLLAVRWEKDRLRKAVRSTLIIQSASYLVLFGAYAMGSSLSLVTKTERVPLTEMSPFPGVVVYFISNADGDAYRLDLAAAIAGGEPDDQSRAEQSWQAWLCVGRRPSSRPSGYFGYREVASGGRDVTPIRCDHSG